MSYNSWIDISIPLGCVSCEKNFESMFLLLTIIFNQANGLVLMQSRVLMAIPEFLINSLMTCRLKAVLLSLTVYLSMVGCCAMICNGA